MLPMRFCRWFVTQLTRNGIQHVVMHFLAKAYLQISQCFGVCNELICACADVLFDTFFV